MKTLKTIILEKLIINKSNNNLKLSKRNLYNIDFKNVKNEIWFKTPAEELTHINKIKAYKKKGSNPKRLANSIKNKQKLMIRWWVAVMNDWIECALVFRDEIIDRKYATGDELDAYILYQYEKYKIYQDHVSFGKIAKSIEKYLDELNVEYETT